MSQITIEISPETYQRVKQQARRQHQSVDSLVRHLVEQNFDAADDANGMTRVEAKPQETPQRLRERLEAAGVLRPLGPALEQQIETYGVPIHEEVREWLAQAEGPSLSEIVDQQRGPKA